MTEVPEFWEVSRDCEDLSRLDKSVEMPAGACFTFGGIPVEVEEDTDGKGCDACFLFDGLTCLCRILVCDKDYRRDRKDVVFVKTNTGDDDESD